MAFRIYVHNGVMMSVAWLCRLPSTGDLVCSSSEVAESLEDEAAWEVLRERELEERAAAHQAYRAQGGADGRHARPAAVRGHP
jgi:hypothetical protein